MPDPYVMNGAIADGLWSVFGVIALVFYVVAVIAGALKK